MTALQSNKQKRDRFCIKILNRILCVCIIVTAAYYVTVVNDLTIKGFKLQKLKDEKESLQQENQKLSLEAMSLRSYNGLAQKTKELNMVSADNIDYVTAMDGMMARK